MQRKDPEEDRETKVMGKVRKQIDCRRSKRKTLEEARKAKDLK